MGYLHFAATSTHREFATTGTNTTSTQTVHPVSAMSRDSAYSYPHLSSLSHVLHMELWKDAPIPYDDIDTQLMMEAVASEFPRLLTEDDDDDGLPMTTSTPGSKFSKNRRASQQDRWMDLNLHDRYLNPESTLHKVHDGTLLKPMFTNTGAELEDSGVLLADFMANGHTHLREHDETNSPDDLHDTSNAADISANFSTDMISHQNNTFSFKVRSNSGSGPAQTPRVRSRHASTEAKGFQTPIARSMR